jgi:hypothetical protein
MHYIKVLHYAIVVAASFTVSFLIVWLALYFMGLLPFVIWWVVIGFFVIATLWFDIIGGLER